VVDENENKSVQYECRCVVEYPWTQWRYR